MYRLSYVSKGVRFHSDAEMRAVNDIFEITNTSLGITGALMYDDAHFAQILEGEQSAVLALLERIKSDERHHGLRIVDGKSVVNRHFNASPMKLIKGLNLNILTNAMVSD